MSGCRFMNSCAIGSWNFANAGNAYSTSSVTSCAYATGVPIAPARAIAPSRTVLLFISPSFWLRTDGDSFDPGHRDALDETASRDQEREDERRGDHRGGGGERAVVRPCLR